MILFIGNLSILFIDGVPENPSVSDMERVDCLPVYGILFYSSHFHYNISFFFTKCDFEVIILVIRKEDEHAGR